MGLIAACSRQWGLPWVGAGEHAGLSTGDEFPDFEASVDALVLAAVFLGVGTYLFSSIQV